VFFQSLAAHSRDAVRADVAGGPPPFIPFAQRGKVENTSKRGVSCLDVLHLSTVCYHCLSVMTIMVHLLQSNSF